MSKYLTVLVNELFFPPATCGGRIFNLFPVTRFWLVESREDFRWYFTLLRFFGLFLWVRLSRLGVKNKLVLPWFDDVEAYVFMVGVTYKCHRKFFLSVKWCGILRYPFLNFCWLSGVLDSVEKGPGFRFLEFNIDDVLWTWQSVRVSLGVVGFWG